LKPWAEGYSPFRAKTSPTIHDQLINFVTGPFGERDQTSKCPAFETHSYSVALALLLFVWFAVTAASAALLVLLFLPNHAGLGDSLHALEVLLPTDLAL
jgi:hypothetical protein